MRGQNIHSAVKLAIPDHKEELESATIPLQNMTAQTAVATKPNQGSAINSNARVSSLFLHLLCTR